LSSQRGFVKPSPRPRVVSQDLTANGDANHHQQNHVLNSNKVRIWAFYFTLHFDLFFVFEPFK
jgi:hypothetical protein